MMNGSNEHALSDMEVSDNEEFSQQHNSIDAWIQDSMPQGQRSQQSYPDGRVYQNRKDTSGSSRSIHINPALTQRFQDAPYYQFNDYENVESAQNNNQRGVIKRSGRAKPLPRLASSKKNLSPKTIVIDNSDESDSGESFVTAPSSPIENRSMTLNGNPKPENDTERLQSDLSNTENELDIVDKELSNLIQKKMELENELLTIKLKETLKRKKINTRVPQQKKLELSEYPPPEHKTEEAPKNVSIVTPPKQTSAPHTSTPSVTKTKHDPVPEKKLFMDTFGKPTLRPTNIFGVSLPPTIPTPVKKPMPMSNKSLPTHNKVAVPGPSERVSFSISQPMTAPVIKSIPLDGTSQSASMESTFPIPKQYSTNVFKRAPLKNTNNPLQYSSLSSSSESKGFVNTLSTNNNFDRAQPQIEKKLMIQGTPQSSTKSRAPKAIFGFVAQNINANKVTPQQKTFSKKVPSFDLIGEKEETKGSNPTSIRPTTVDRSDVAAKKDTTASKSVKESEATPTAAHPLPTDANNQKFIHSTVPYEIFGGCNTHNNSPSNQAEKTTTNTQSNGKSEFPSIKKEESALNSYVKTSESTTLMNTSPETPRPKVNLVEILAIAQVLDHREKAKKLAEIQKNQPKPDYTGLSLLEILGAPSFVSSSTQHDSIKPTDHPEALQNGISTKQKERYLPQTIDKTQKAVKNEPVQETHTEQKTQNAVKIESVPETHTEQKTQKAVKNEPVQEAHTEHESQEIVKAEPVQETRTKHEAQKSVKSEPIQEPHTKQDPRKTESAQQVESDDILTRKRSDYKHSDLNIVNKKAKYEREKSKEKSVAIFDESPGAATTNIPEPMVPDVSIKPRTTSFTAYESPLKVFGINHQEYQPPQATSKPKKPFNKKSTLCKFEASGGTCNNDTCTSIHFRDFQ